VRWFIILTQADHSCCCKITALITIKLCQRCVLAIFTRMQDQVFPWIWCLNVWGHLKFTYEVLSQTRLSQTKACITKSSCEISTFLRYYTVLSGNSLPTFWDNLLVPCLRVKKSKRENTAQLKLIEAMELSIIWFVKEAWHFGNWLFLFLGKEVLNLMDPLDWGILYYWPPQKQ
jgi:hypothetical protein